MTTRTEDFRPRGFDSYPIALGDMLRGERATAGKSIEDVQSELKINSKYIHGIEDGDLSAFDTKGFIAGYVRSYARYLNLDGDLAYEKFCVETGFNGLKPTVAHRETPSKNAPITQGAILANTKPPKMTPIKMPAPRWYQNISFSAIGSLVVLMALVTGLGYAGWNVLQEVQRVQFAPVNEVPGVTSNILVLSDGGISDDTSPILDKTAVDGVSSNLTVSLDQLYRPQELEVPSVISRDGPISTINSETLGTYAPKPDFVVPVNVQTDSPVATVVQGPPTIDVVATRPAWIRISLPDSSVLFEKILNAGERYRLPAGLQGALLKAGNSGAVYFMIDHKTYGPVGAKGAIARKISLVQSDIEGNYSEVVNLFSAPLAPPLNAESDQTAEAILEELQNN
jgi:cytoskeletal protein RodZ